MLNTGIFNKHVSWAVLNLDDMVGFHCCPVAKVEAEDVEGGIGRDVRKASRRKNCFIQDKIGPYEAFLNLKWSRRDTVL